MPDAVSAMTHADDRSEPLPPVAPPLHVLFEGLSRPVTFAGAAATLLERVAELTRGWPYRTLDSRDEEMPDAAVVVGREGASFRIDAPWLPQPVIERSALRAAANLAVDLIEAYLADRPSALGLHCGAAAFDGRLVLFPSRARAGKSTLMVRLAAGGVPVFTDDVLVLCNGDRDGLSLGMLPRLRLPIPAQAGTPFKAFVRSCRGPHDRDYRYVSMPPALAPRYGRVAPVGAIVLLDRVRDGPAELRPASRGDGLQELIGQNLSATVRSSDAVARLAALMERVPCLSLRYATLDDAFDLLQQRFAKGDGYAVARHATNVTSPQVGAAPAPEAGPGPRYRRARDVAVHAIDAERFLVHAETEAVFRLNPVAAGLWQLLSQPASVADAVSILHGAFPDRDLRQIEHDVATLFDALHSLGLIRPDRDLP